MISLIGGSFAAGAAPDWPFFSAAVPPSLNPLMQTSRENNESRGADTTPRPHLPLRAASPPPPPALPPLPALPDSAPAPDPELELEPEPAPAPAACLPPLPLSLYE